MNKQTSEKIFSRFLCLFRDLKSKMTADIEDKTDYESMDKTDFLDDYFFKGDNIQKKVKIF